MNSKMQMAVTTGSPTLSSRLAASPLRAASVIVWKSKVPNVTVKSITPSRNPASPMRFTTNAFLPASAADFLLK